MTQTATGTLFAAEAASTRSAAFFAIVSKSMGLSFFRSETQRTAQLRCCTHGCLAPELPYIKSQPIFRVARLVKAPFQQRLDPSCAAGRVTEVMQASHPAAISTSGGRLAAFTRRFVLAIAHLSNEAIRVASASTKSSSAASGNERFT